MVASPSLLSYFLIFIFFIGEVRWAIEFGLFISAGEGGGGGGSEEGEGSEGGGRGWGTMWGGGGGI